MKTVNPYLNFPGNTEEAFEFYRSVFGGDFAAVVRFRDFGDNPMGIPEADLDKIAHIGLPLGSDNMLMASDTLESFPREHRPGNAFYIMLDAESEEEARRLFESLSEGGEVEMPLQRTEWAENYGHCTDRFGVQWMVNHTGGVHFPPSAPES